MGFFSFPRPRSRANPFAWFYNSKRPQLPSEIKFDKVNPFPSSRANPFAWLYNSKSPQLPSEIKFDKVNLFAWSLNYYNSFYSKSPDFEPTQNKYNENSFRGMTIQKSSTKSISKLPRSRANPFAWLYNSKSPQLPSEIKFDKVNPFAWSLNYYNSFYSKSPDFEPTQNKYNENYFREMTIQKSNTKNTRELHPRAFPIQCIAVP
jgi:hypothetical protein